MLRNDAAFMVATGRDADDAPLASQPTMSRFENSVKKRDLLRLFYVFIDNFLDSYVSAPDCMIIDMDPSAHRTYGDQQLSLFNFHYDGYCLMPFYVYEGQSGKLISMIVRPGKTPTDSEIIALLKRIVKRIRKRFPETVLTFRGDSHHTKPAVLDWLEEHDLYYVLGMATNAVLAKEVAPPVSALTGKGKDEMAKIRCFHSFFYAAGTWSKERRIVARIEASGAGTDSRFIVTNFESASAKYLYETVYCDRGNAELCIKEAKCFLHSDRNSCTEAEANQLRLFLHGAAYVILHSFRESVLKDTEWEDATFQTIQLRLLKIAARIEKAKTFIRFHLSETSPAIQIFKRITGIIAEISRA